MTDKQPCIAYAAGPGDVVKTFAHWQKGEDDPHQVARPYSGQFLDYCARTGAKGVLISSCPRADRVTAGDFHVENLPKPAMAGGVSFHLAQIRYARQVLKKVTALGADMLVIADATGHFFPFGWMAPRRVQLIPSLHCTLWPQYLPIKPVRKIINRLDRYFFAARARGILCLSEDIRRQIDMISHGRPRPIHPFIPTYRRETFAGIAPPVPGGVFNLLFAGRIEPEKGVFELLDMAVRLKNTGHASIVMHICGDGSREDELRSRAREQGVEDTFRIHGYCHREEMLGHIGSSHAFIVPTTTTFGEGFNKVVAEAVLAGRPVITSSVCPALEYVRDAVMEVGPDDWDGYLAAVEGLASDRELYEAKQRACGKLREQFYDPARSWGSALARAVAGEG